MFEPKVRINYQNVHKTRNGRGFSRKEIIEAGITMDEALWIGIPVDAKRKSLYEENVETIHDILEHIEELQKEYEEQKKIEQARQEEIMAEKEKVSKKKKKEKKPKKETKKKVEEVLEEETIEEEAPQVQAASESLETIPGIGPKTAERLTEAGYSTVEDIVNATVDELAEIKGISKKSATEMIEKAKEL